MLTKSIFNMSDVMSFLSILMKLNCANNSEIQLSVIKILEEVILGINKMDANPPTNVSSNTRNG